MPIIKPKSVNRNTKESGNSLEIIIAMLEYSLITNPNTTIKRNHLVVDKDGFNREIDIYVITEINNKLLKYAIECKNYGNNVPVKMSDIDVFFAKICELGCKGIFISTGKYQANAILKAKKLNIDLYTLDQAPENQKIGFKISNINSKIIEQKTVFYNNITGAIQSKHLRYIYDDEKNKTPKKEFIKVVVDCVLFTLKKDAIDLVKKMHEELKGKRKRFNNRRKFYLQVGIDKPYYYKLINEYELISDHWVLIEVWMEEPFESLTRPRLYQNLSGDKIFAKLLSEEVFVNGEPGILNFVILDNDELKINFLTKNSIEEFRSREL